jgi:uncharacterized protein (DUF924 family)
VTSKVPLLENAEAMVNTENDSSMKASRNPYAVLDFWFSEIDRENWFRADPDFDMQIRERFGDLHRSAAAGELFTWRSTATGMLAEVIILDQFSRNVHRGTAAAFASDPLALAVAQQAVAIHADKELETAQRNFLYLPYMHSESLVIHDAALELFENHADASTLDYERRHRAIIERFGRYPHRNDILGRQSTAEELAFLSEPGSSF